jgi:glycosyltransferase involved in cell wall biosynthesis
MEKLNILHISNPVGIPVKGYGGTERVVYALAKEQSKNGHNVAVIAGKPSTIPGVRDLSFLESLIYSEKKFIIKRFISMYSLRAFLKSRQYDYDIIHNHISEEGITATVLAKSKVITTLHCPTSLRKFWPFLTTSLAAIFPRNTKFVTISRRAYVEYKKFFKNDLLTYIHNGIDITHIPFNPNPQKDCEIQLCFLGKFIYEKQPHLAIKIVDILHEWGYNVCLFMMGKLDFPLTKYAKKLISMIKSRKYVKFLPNVQTELMYRILGSCDALLVTSFEIGLITAHLEALATGTPIVGFANSSAEEVVIDGYNGYLGKDLIDVANKCIKVSEIDRSNCRKFVEDNFNIQKMYEKYMKVYKKILFEI